MRQRAAVMLLAAWCTAALGAEAIVREQFAYEVPIVAADNASVYRVPLIADVYRNVSRADLGDLRVFNAAGQIVPHALVRPVEEPVSMTVALPLFAVPVKTTVGIIDKALIKRAPDGSILSVQSREARTSERMYYLLDASRVADPLAALEVDWTSSEGSGFIANVQIEESADLKSWSAVAQGALANLARDGQLLSQKRVSLPLRKFKYLRLAWVNPATNARITAVRAELRPKVEVQRDWVSVIGVAEEEAGSFRFEVDGSMPIDRARVLLPTNSVAQVTLLSRARDGDSWTLRGEKTVFVLADPRGELKDNEIVLRPGGPARQWRLQLRRRSVGTDSTPPGLEFGWVPHQLVLVARGASPFTLAYGHAGITPVDDGVDELVRRSKRDDAERVEIRDAKFGTPYAQRGKAALSIPWYRGDWKQWLLWTVLVLGVAVLGYVATRLVRQMTTTATRNE